MGQSLSPDLLPLVAAAAEVLQHARAAAAAKALQRLEAPAEARALVARDTAVRAVSEPPESTITSRKCWGDSTIHCQRMHPSDDASTVVCVRRASSLFANQQTPPRCFHFMNLGIFQHIEIRTESTTDVIKPEVSNEPLLNSSYGTNSCAHKKIDNHPWNTP